jgi:hypothetical protein
MSYIIRLNFKVNKNIIKIVENTPEIPADSIRKVSRGLAELPL